MEKDSQAPESEEDKRILVQEALLTAALLDTFLAQTPPAGSDPSASCPTELHSWWDHLIENLPTQGPQAGLSNDMISDSMALLGTVKAVIATSEEEGLR